uniref:Uncharacterized protein n=1 Tax=Cacopsylla melanoneura TaxID=428564 RepID=A0A8D8QDW5_9HEMI
MRPSQNQGKQPEWDPSFKKVFLPLSDLKLTKKTKKNGTKKCTTPFTNLARTKTMLPFGTKLNGKMVTTGIRQNQKVLPETNTPHWTGDESPGVTKKMSSSRP